MQLQPKRSQVARAVDLAVYLFISFLGIFQFTHYQHAPDYLNDVTYPDLASSLLHHSAYTVRLLPETTLPPGLPLVLTIVGRFFGLTPAVSFGVIAISTAVGLFVTYEFLRRVEGRAVAAVACLLFASSPVLFEFNTGLVFPEMPYFCVSMAVLLLSLKVDRFRQTRSAIPYLVLLGFGLPLAILIRSVGVALLLGIVSWCCASLVLDRDNGRKRIARFAVPFVLAMLAQLTWGIWAQRHQVVEWQLPGYPGSYMSQLRVKDGQHPELGYATISDVPARIAINVVTRETGFLRLMLRRNFAEFWSSPAIAGFTVVLLIGLWFSVKNGGQLCDWYFLFYECIFLAWPWDYRDRFVFPIVPLACLYLWRGILGIRNLLIARPKWTSLGLAFAGLLLCFASAAFALGFLKFHVNPRHVHGDHLQVVLVTFFWGLFSIAAFLVFRVQQIGGSASIIRMAHTFRPGLSISAAILTVSTVAFLVITGAKAIIVAGRANLDPDPAEVSLFPEFKASNWIRTHEPEGAVVMAREPEFVFHYSHEKTVWFPPISNAGVLMDGIRRHQVGIIEVSRHENSYWLPSEEDCFESLSRSYGVFFRLVQRDSDYQVYEVLDRPAIGSRPQGPGR